MIVSVPELETDRPLVIQLIDAPDVRKAPRPARSELSDGVVAGRDTLPRRVTCMLPPEGKLSVAAEIQARDRRSGVPAGQSSVRSAAQSRRESWINRTLAMARTRIAARAHAVSGDRPVDEPGIVHDDHHRSMRVQVTDS
ncbi:hypothetical protein [Xanthobacter sediminis]